MSTSGGSQSELDGSQSELEELRAKNRELAEQVQELTRAQQTMAGRQVAPTQYQPRKDRRPLRNGVAGVFAFLTALLLVSAVVGSWTTNTALDTDKFVARVGPIIDEPDVRQAVSSQLTTQITDALNLQAKIEPALPQNIKFLAGPIASGADSFIGTQVSNFVDTDAFRTLWDNALRLSQERVAAALTGQDTNLVVVDGTVNIDLISVVNAVLAELSNNLPTILGNSVQLSIPPDANVTQITAIVQKYLGVELPENFAQIPIMNASDLEAAQTGVQVVSTGNILLFVGALICLILALAISAGRRRTVFVLGMSVALVTGIVFFALRAVNQSTLAGISDPELQTAASTSVRVIFETLRSAATALVIIGVLLALVAYLVGPGRFPVWLRSSTRKAAKKVSQSTQDAATSDRTAAFARTYLDPLRFGAIIVAVLALLIWSSWLSFGIILAVLVIFEVVVTIAAGRADDPAPDQS